MKNSISLSALVALLSISIDTVSAGCFSGGDTFPDKGNARYHAERACRGYDGHGGAFSGTFGGGERKWACVQLSSTIKMDFSIQNLNNRAALDLGDDDCVLRLHNEINGCDHGGDSTISGWNFVVDPNNGNC
ncbi:hypothetical protein GQ44DRAFT_775850 [Phaeosphaeriaceae sp. PMI808]|nr:hypothetical protein GQ44DRAFT_775850 [Phaeosphaeriaceae sp. PMI808]